jgi:coenzyme F420-dependent glucose-6-phosphate dehydrogenase
MLSLGWKASPEQYSPERLLEFAVAAEDAGFDCLSISDHFHPWSEAGPCSFPWTWLGAAAAMLKRMDIGTAVTCPILRYHPAIIAQAVATIDNMAQGRAYLGVGTGEALNEYSSVGAWPDYNMRQEMLREAMDLIRSLWTGDEVTFDGHHYHTRKARLYTPPRGPIDLYISSMVPESAYFAGLFGDGLITVGGGSPEHYRAMLANFDAGAMAAGKDPAQLPRHIEITVAYTDDVEAAVEPIKKYWTGTFIHAMHLQNLYTPKMSAMNGSIVGTDVIKQKKLISADPEKHAQMAQQFIDMGFTRLIFGTAGPDETGFIEAYGREVLPRIRERNEQVVVAAPR